MSEVLTFKLILVFAVFGITLLVAMYSTYLERKVAAFIQDRVGPDRAGPFGLLQPLADGVKMFMKEEIIPNVSNKTLFIIGPCIAMLTAIMAGVVIPWGGTLEINGTQYNLQIADLNIGILYIFAVVSFGVYGIMVGGWASNNKFSLLGAIRASAQMISYELAMGLSIIALIMITGTLSLSEISSMQGGGIGDQWNLWNIVYQPVGFMIFIICAFAECNRMPFDLPETETELVGGYHTEYSSMKLGFYLFAEYINMFTSSAVMSTLYFGGYNFPFMNDLGLAPNVVTILGTVALFLKIGFFIFFFMWVRWTLPRFRYDQLMNLGWKVLIPLAILNVAITGLVMILTQ
ncbi:NADH-quinone oxidoreductase subunit NuoH [Fulvivirgaceae bacterium PWU4]|uniref:NADH-quinone oxidoreductase subunit H n=1 Tax=Chryseosolibacter histidini TaxID=2782349 RepID=A0AAP2GPI8_9BACT|nr:NADH-quinone oxidoreductase subunit NuoH [Chryseosolibacter histidini]MBT1698005.1 NADH-quinone oxidoreductase subunit NuoH [Chryseosolibacter histidini]